MNELKALKYTIYNKMNRINLIKIVDEYCWGNGTKDIYLYYECIKIKNNDLLPCLEKNQIKTKISKIFDTKAYHSDWPLNFYLPHIKSPLNFLIRNWAPKSNEIIISQYSHNSRLFRKTNISELGENISKNGYMLEIVTEETERSLYLDIDSRHDKPDYVDPDHALWCSIRLIHKILTTYFHLNITLRRLWDISTIMSNYRNNKTSFHVKFEGIGFRNYKTEQKFKAILNYPDELNLRQNGKPIIDLYAMGKSKQYMRMPNQGKKYGESGFKVLKIAKK